MSAWVGVDVGGTFTDVIAYTDYGQRATIAKVPSTPDDPGTGLLRGLQEVLRRAGAEPADVTSLVHGSTVGTNAVLERNGARVGIITTEGFEDTLYIGRAKRSQMYDLMIGPSTPYFLCPRNRVRGVPGRLGPNGETVDPLDEQAVVAAVESLVRHESVESIAVCLLMSFTSPRQEERVEQLIKESFPSVSVSLSSRVDPRFREYERLVVTTLDAYIRPLVGTYIGGLRDRLHSLGVSADLQIMESHGGIVDSSLVVQRSVGTLLSGLAGGAIGAGAVGAAAARRQLISFDMGGTSTDVTLVVGSRPLIGDEGWLGEHPLRLPMVDVHTIGAGGGSVAHVDAAGSLRVGPHSAGAFPGPASYAQGGDQATVTDANVVLGYLGTGGLAGGTIGLNPELAAEALSTKVAEPLGMATVDAAWGVHRIAVAAMAAAVRVVSIARGHDPRDFALLACGGAGPLHACSVADELGIDEIIVPPYPGVLSAYGLLAADVEIPQWRTFHTVLEPERARALKAALADVAADVRQQMMKVGVDQHDAVRVECTTLVRYVGQSHELRIRVQPDLDEPDFVASIQSAFTEEHHRVFGQNDPEGRVEVTGISVTAVADRKAPAPGAPAGEGLPSSRTIFVPESGRFEPTTILQRGALQGVIEGPALILQEDTTTLIRRGWSATHHESGSLLLRRNTDM